MYLNLSIYKRLDSLHNYTQALSIIWLTAIIEYKYLIRDRPA